MIEAIINEAAGYFFHAAVVTLCGVITLIWRRISAVQLGLQTLLYDRLIQEHDYYLQKGYMPIHNKEAYHRKYAAYKGLGLDGVMAQPYEEVMALPTVNPAKEGEK